MAGKDTDEVRIGANGSVFVAPVGTAFPDSIDEDIPVGWVELGYTSEDGVTATNAKTTDTIPVWQLFHPARRIVTEVDFTVAFVLRQWSAATVRLAYGGGTISEDAPGQFRYTPPAPEVIDERALIVEWLDGDKKYRFEVARTMVTENVETNLTRTAAADLPITLGVLGSEGVEPWELTTNDEAFAETPS